VLVVEPFIRRRNLEDEGHTMGEEDHGAVCITEGFVQQPLAQWFIGLAHTHVVAGAQPAIQ